MRTVKLNEIATLKNGTKVKAYLADKRDCRACCFFTISDGCRSEELNCITKDQILVFREVQ